MMSKVHAKKRTITFLPLLPSLPPSFPYLWYS